MLTVSRILTFAEDAILPTVSPLGLDRGGIQSMIASEQTGIISGCCIAIIVLIVIIVDETLATQMRCF